MTDQHTAALRAYLAASVPAAMCDYMDRGGPSTADIAAARRFLTTVSAHEGRPLQRFPVPGETEVRVVGLARALAALSFCDGGVQYAGLTWQAVLPGGGSLPAPPCALSL